MSEVFGGKSLLSTTGGAVWECFGLDVFTDVGDDSFDVFRTEQGFERDAVRILSDDFTMLEKMRTLRDSARQICGCSLQAPASSYERATN